MNTIASIPQNPEIPTPLNTEVLGVLDDYRIHISDLEQRVVEYIEAIRLSKDSAAIYAAHEMVKMPDDERRILRIEISRHYADLTTVAQINTELARIDNLRTMPYSEYLKSDHWQALRLQALKRADYRCQICNRNDVSLHTHHRTYERRGFEDISDLIVLCADCHKTFHENGKVSQ